MLLTGYSESWKRKYDPKGLPPVTAFEQQEYTEGRLGESRVGGTQVPADPLPTPNPICRRSAGGQAQFGYCL